MLKNDELKYLCTFGIKHKFLKIASMGLQFMYNKFRYFTLQNTTMTSAASIQTHTY